VLHCICKCVCSTVSKGIQAKARERERAKISKAANPILWQIKQSEAPAGTKTTYSLYACIAFFASHESDRKKYCRLKSSREKYSNVNSKALIQIEK
jgi:hypothetical protein